MTFIADQYAGKRASNPRTGPASDLFIDRRTFDGDHRPLADLARHYIVRQKAFDAKPDSSDAEIEAFDDEQAALLERIERTPVVTLDDIVAKLELTRFLILYSLAGNEPDDGDRLAMTLTDDFRGVFGAMLGYPAAAE